MSEIVSRSQFRGWMRNTHRSLEEEMIATRHVRFGTSDERLREELSRVIRHIHELSKGTDIGCGFYDIFGMDEGCYGKNDPSIIGISELPNDQGMQWIANDLNRGRPCAAIVRTEDRQKWRELADLHARTPLRFIVATGGPQDRFVEMFPGIRVAYFSDLEQPYDRMIAEYIVNSVKQMATMA